MRTIGWLGALAGIVLLAHGNAWSQAYPSKPVRVVIVFAPGGATDVVGRMVFQKVSEQMNQQFVIDNRAGAGGTLGAAVVAKAAPDGTTLLVHSAGHVVNPALYANLSYDTLKDFAGVTPLASLPNVLVTSPGRFKDVRDLVEQAKARPGTQNYGSAGNGSATKANGLSVAR